MNVSDHAASKRTSPRNLTHNHPYTSSIASSAASSSSSVFSADAHSSQSSAPSSAKSLLQSGWESDNAYPQVTIDNKLTSSTASQYGERPVSDSLASRARIAEDVVAPEMRLHPRRTQPLAPSNTQSGYPTARPPPALTRQCDRKDNFVESLVGKLTYRNPSSNNDLFAALQDTTTQMIEVIWPLSVGPSGRDTVLGGKNLLGLRTFIQEVLKRSKTSYSTLQVALYYLVLIKPHVPGINFTMEQSEETHASRAMQCGRRMFLAALILASKYLQDRNYSARAWSKISGLKVSEINSNEIAFVTAIGWRLHVPTALFQRWTDVVLKFSPPTSPSSPGYGIQHSSGINNQFSVWRSIIPLLTPKLDGLDGLDIPRTVRRESDPQILRSTSPAASTRRVSSWLNSSSSSNESTPTMSRPKPLALEPTIRDFPENRPRFPPISPKILPLPTPQITPQCGNFGTPAVCATPFFSGKSAMSCAWKQVQRTCLARSTLDPWPSVAGVAGPPRYACLTKNPLMPTRRSSLARSASSTSSPESMISDRSTRSSRSSSISSVTSLQCAPPQPRLAVQATRRCANMQLLGIKEDSPVTIRTSPESMAMETLTASPMSYNVGPKESFVRDVGKSQALLSNSMDLGFSERDAAEGLRDLALNRHGRILPPLTSSIQSSSSRSTPTGRKRERPSSISDPTLQETVRGLLQPASTKPSTSSYISVDEEDGTVLQDSKVADSFTLQSNFKLPHLDGANYVQDSGEYSRKRPCYMEAQGRGMVPRLEMNLISAAGGPGMWKYTL